MAIDLDTGLDNAFSGWLESKEARAVQRDLENKIVALLFSQDPSSASFRRMVEGLAWIRAQPEGRDLLERDIRLLEEPSFQACGFWKGGL